MTARGGIVRGYDGKRPRLGRGVFVAENAAIIGDVEIGDDSSVWYSTTIRGDVMAIRIGARTSVQDGTVVHVTAGVSGTTIGSDCTIGHAAVIHACVVEDRCLVGMGAILLDGCRIGAGSFVGAGALVTPGTHIPPGSFVLGAPARVKRPVDAREIAAIDEGARHYVEVARRYLAGDDESSLR
jgi:carbonic anhydrase/acetyltransferase-like protein (isoleucine patch superfamily)